MIAAMDGNLKCLSLNPERSEVCNIIDNLSAHNPVTGSAVDPTEDSTISNQMDHKNSPIPLTNASNIEGPNLLPIYSALPTTRLGVPHSQPQTDGNSEFDEQTTNEAQHWAVAKHQPQPISLQLSPYQRRLESTSISGRRRKTSTAQINQGDGDGIYPFYRCACLFSHTHRPVCLHPSGMSFLPALGLFTGHWAGFRCLCLVLVLLLLF